MSDISWIATAWGDAAAVRVADDAPAAALPAIDPGEVLARLHPEERAAGAALPIARRREWAAGRLALRAAIERAGLALDAPIGADDRGAPRVGAGVIGSISHKRGLATAIAARDDDGARLGLDLELDAPPKIDIERRVLTPAEREALTDPDRGRAVMLRFAIKEAIYKAIDPFVRRYVGFQEVELELRDQEAIVTSSLELAIEARWLRFHDCILALARARRLTRSP